MSDIVFSSSITDFGRILSWLALGAGTLRLKDFEAFILCSLFKSFIEVDFI